MSHPVIPSIVLRVDWLWHRPAPSMEWNNPWREMVRTDLPPCQMLMLAHHLIPPSHIKEMGLATKLVEPSYAMCDFPLVLTAISRRTSIPSLTVDYAPLTKITTTSNKPTTQPTLEPQKSVSVVRQMPPPMNQKSPSSMGLEESGYPTSPQGSQREGGVLGRRDSLLISEMPPGPGALHLAAK